MCVLGEGGHHLQVNKYRSEEEEDVSVETKREGRVSETTGSLQSPATLEFLLLLLFLVSTFDLMILSPCRFSENRSASPAKTV